MRRLGAASIGDLAASVRRRAAGLGLRLRGRRLPLVHHRAYRRGFTGVPLDTMRGERIAAFLLDRGWVQPRDLLPAHPAPVEAIHRVHSPDYLRKLDDPEEVGRILGVALTPEQSRFALRLQRLMTGGTIRAARLAHDGRCPVAHLGGGLHHAGPEFGGGFCLLNDVAVAVGDLRARGFRPPIVVVDLDIHDGNGTRAVFARDPSVHTYSVHNRAWDDRPASGSTSVALGSGVGDEDYLEALRQTLPAVVRDHRPELAFYIAGADVAAEDHYGDWEVSPAAILERDRFVIRTLRREAGDVPLVVLLGGGYGGHAWRSPARFLAWLLTGRPYEPPDDVTAALHRVRWLEEPRTDPADGLHDTTAGTGRPDAQPPASRSPYDWRLTEEDLAGVLPAAGEERRLLGHLSARGVEQALERFGVLSHIRARGYFEPTIEIVPASGLGPTLRVYGGSDRSDLLVELRLGVDGTTVPGLRLLVIEWLLLQDPRGRFPPRRSALPGQARPGFGALADLVAWLVAVCEELGLDGLGFRSSHFHVAELARRHLRFLRPEDRRRFAAIRRAVRGMPLAEASRAVERGEVKDPETGETLEWKGVPMVVPVSPALHRRLRTPAPAEVR